MKKIVLKLIEKHYDQIFNSWLEKLITSFGDRLSKSQLRTFVDTSLLTLMEIIKSSEYFIADDYLIDAYNLFSKTKLNLLEVSQIFSQGRSTFLNVFESDKDREYDPIILLHFIDELIEQLFARYSMIHQSAQMKELVKDRDRLANKLDINQSHLKTILHKSETAIAVIDPDEKFISWNKGAEKIFGYTETEVLGKPSAFLMPNKEKYYKELKFIINEVHTSGDVKLLDTERKTKDGRIIPVELTVTSLPSSNNKYVGRTVIIKDQTEVKELQQQIDQSEKLAVIGQLAAGVAHEIGNPLASISSLVQIIQRRNKDDKLNEQLITIKENIDRISSIVRELVDFSRPPGYEKVLLQVSDVIRTAVGIVKYDKRVKKVNFETDFDQNIPMIRIVPDQLLQVFVNILINALDAIEGKGTIEAKSYRKNDCLIIDIKDNGCGMSKEVTKKIFDPFFTTKEVGRGTGLGLSVSYGIIKKFSGDIHVESVLDAGSKFSIKLPIKE